MGLAILDLHFPGLVQVGRELFRVSSAPTHFFLGDIGERYLIGYNDLGIDVRSKVELYNIYTYYLSNFLGGYQDDMYVR